MTDKIRWFRCVVSTINLTKGKLYPATTVDEDGDLAVVDDGGDPWWVETKENPYDKINTEKVISMFFEEVTRDDD